MILFNNGAGVAAAMASYYRNYLVSCEYLQIDPRIAYDTDFIEERVERVLLLWEEQDEYKKLKKQLKMFLNNYKRYIGKWFRFPKLIKKYSENKKFTIDEETISEYYVMRPLTTNNYKSYNKYQIRVLFIVLGILFAFLAMMIPLLMYQ